MWETTSWSQILAAQQDNESALQMLYEDYWPAICTFLQSKGLSLDDAEDFAQSFFAKFLESKWVQLANPEKGRFRTFLLTLLTRFVRDQRELRQKKFENKLLYLDKSSLDRNIRNHLSPEENFNYIWAQSLIEIVLNNYRKEAIQQKQHLEYEVLWLYFFAGSAILRIGDLKDPAKFWQCLQSQEDSLSIVLVDKFSDASLEHLQKYQVGNYPEINQQKTIIQNINYILKSKPLFDQDFADCYSHQWQLFPQDIKDAKVFLKQFTHIQDDVSQYLFSSFSLETQSILDKYQKGRVAIKNALRQLLDDLNTVMQKPLNIAGVDNADISTRRYFIEKTYSSLIHPGFIRLNRFFLEKFYPKQIISNFYDWVGQPSYEQIAEHLQQDLTKVKRAMKKAAQRYQAFLRLEVARYTDEDYIDEEIQELLKILENS